MSHLTPQEISTIFINTPLEENYNFLQEDLVKLANAFISAAEKKITTKERKACIDVARAVNTLVADKIAEVRR